jgi:hypothetical protein
MAQGLGHIIDSTYDIVLEDLHKMQCDWVYNLMHSKLKTPKARRILENNKDGRNPCAIWIELKDVYSTSTATDLRIKSLVNYLSSARLDKTTWNGTQANWIIHYEKQSRLHDEIATAKFTDSQKIQFLRTAVSGVPNLANVAKTQETLCRMLGQSPDTLSFENYVSELLHAAELHNGVKSSRSRNSDLQGNIHSVEDNSMNGQDSMGGFGVNVHDIDTDIDDLMQYSSNNHNFKSKSNNKSKNPNLVRLDRDTWFSMSKEEQKAWDTLSDASKKAIIAFGAKKRDKESANKSNNFKANNHETESGTASGNEDDENRVWEVSTHDLSEGSALKPTSKSNDTSEAPIRHLIWIFIS